MKWINIGEVSSFWPPPPTLAMVPTIVPVFLLAMMMISAAAAAGIGLYSHTDPAFGTEPSPFAAEMWNKWRRSVPHQRVMRVLERYEQLDYCDDDMIGKRVTSSLVKHVQNRVMNRGVVIVHNGRRCRLRVVHKYEQVDTRENIEVVFKVYKNEALVVDMSCAYRYNAHMFIACIVITALAVRYMNQPRLMRDDDPFDDAYYYGDE